MESNKDIKIYVARSYEDGGRSSGILRKTLAGLGYTVCEDQEYATHLLVDDSAKDFELNFYRPCLATALERGQTLLTVRGGIPCFVDRYEGMPSYFTMLRVETAKYGDVVCSVGNPPGYERNPLTPVIFPDGEQPASFRESDEIPKSYDERGGRYICWKGLYY